MKKKTEEEDKKLEQCREKRVETEENEKKRKENNVYLHIVMKE